MEQTSNSNSLLRSRTCLVFLGFAAIALFFLWEEHKAHILGVLPYVLFLVCPLMHLFHGGRRQTLTVLRAANPRFRGDRGYLFSQEVFMKESFLALILFFCATATSGAQTSSPYAGQETREIKALSLDEINGYLSGDGMGFAKAAELNHYPGPKHVLQLADQLQLSEEQRRRTKAIFEEMNSNAVNLGKQLVQKEWRLDSRFVDANISDAELVQLVTEISVTQGKLRTVHLRAHLAQRVVLTQDQIRIYDGLRRYQQPTTDDPHAGH